MTGTNKQGFFSGFHPVDKVLDDVGHSFFLLLTYPSFISLTTHTKATQILYQNQRHRPHILLLLRSWIVHQIRHGRRHQPQFQHLDHNTTRPRTQQRIHAQSRRTVSARSTTAFKPTQLDCRPSCPRCAETWTIRWSHRRHSRRSRLRRLSMRRVILLLGPNTNHQRRSRAQRKQRREARESRQHRFTQHER